MSGARGTKHDPVGESSSSDRRPGATAGSCRVPPGPVRVRSRVVPSRCRPRDLRRPAHELLTSAGRSGIGGRADRMGGKSVAGPSMTSWYRCSVRVDVAQRCSTQVATVQPALGSAGTTQQDRSERSTCPPCRGRDASRAMDVQARRTRRPPAWPRPRACPCAPGPSTSCRPCVRREGPLHGHRRTDRVGRCSGTRRRRRRPRWILHARASRRDRRAHQPVVVRQQGAIAVPKN